MAEIAFEAEKSGKHPGHGAEQEHEIRDPGEQHDRAKPNEESSSHQERCGYIALCCVAPIPSAHYSSREDCPHDAQDHRECEEEAEQGSDHACGSGSWGSGCRRRSGGRKRGTTRPTRGTALPAEAFVQRQRCSTANTGLRAGQRSRGQRDSARAAESISRSILLTAGGTTHPWPLHWNYHFQPAYARADGDASCSMSTLLRPMSRVCRQRCRNSYRWALSDHT